MRPNVIKTLAAVVAIVLPQHTFAQDKNTEYKSVSKDSNTKINTVISTLKDILQSVTNEEIQETQMYHKYTQWCGTTTASLSKELTDTRTSLDNAKVQHEELSSTVDSLTLTIKKNEKDMEETKDAVAQAVALRTDENDKYTEEMQLNTQSLRQIDKAIEHIQKVNQQGGFLQNGVVKKLTLNQPGESSYVLGVMKGLKEKLEKNRNEMQSVEEEKVRMHNSFMQTKQQIMSSLQEATTQKKIELTETQGKKTSTERNIVKLTDEIKSLEDQSKRTGDSCTSTNEEWTARQADRTKEKAALNEAIRFLEESNKEKLLLLQHKLDNNDDDSVVFNPSFLQTASDSKYADNAFFAAANAELSGDNDEVDNHMRKDSFDGVKSVVQKLIKTHQEDQVAETDKRKYCEQEIASKDDDKAQTETDLAAVKADIQKKTSEVEELTQDVENMYKEIDDIKKALDDATKIRKEEATLYESSSKDRGLAIKVLKQAKTVLQEFYDGKKSLIQDGQEPPQKWSAGSPRKTTASFGAASMIQDIVDDVTKEQADATKSEEDAKVAFGKLAKDSRQNTDQKHADITQCVTSKAKLGVQINTLKETQQQKTDDLGSINQQLKSLHEACDELLQFYDKRVKARSFEISQLRDVHDVLSGSSIAARTGLVEEDESDSSADN